MGQNIFNTHIDRGLLEVYICIDKLGPSAHFGLFSSTSSSIHRERLNLSISVRSRQSVSGGRGLLVGPVAVVSSAAAPSHGSASASAEAASAAIPIASSEAAAISAASSASEAAAISA